MNENNRSCPNCNHTNRKEAKFCTGCGAQLESRACANCGIASDPGDRYCRACGSFLRPRAPQRETKTPAAPKAEVRPGAAPTPELNKQESALYETLRRWRSEQAQKENVPRYAVFHNASLAEMARLRPASKAELGGIRGVSAAKVEKYGEALLDLLAKSDKVQEPRGLYARAGLA
jgi:superfamily II DNA helicase RecQ